MFGFRSDAVGVPRTSSVGIGTVFVNVRDKLEKRRTTAILRNDWHRYARPWPAGGNMATTQDETIAELQRAITVLRQERDTARAERDAALAQRNS